MKDGPGTDTAEGPVTDTAEGPANDTAKGPVNGGDLVLDLLTLGPHAAQKCNLAPAVISSSASGIHC